MMNEISDAFEKIVSRRRSIRVFTPSPIPEEILRRSFELAILSPSSSNLQPWQFIRIRNQDEKIRECFLNQSAVMSAPDIVVAVARPDLWRESNSKLLARLLALGSSKPPHFDYLVHYHTRTVPFGHDRGWLNLRGLIRYLAVFLIGLIRPVVREGYFSRSLRERAVKGTALACQTFMLAVAAHGYDTCPMEGFDSQRLRKVLGLPRGAAIVMGIAVGKASPTYTPPLRLRFEYADTILEYP